MLNDRERNTYEIIGKVIEGIITIKEAMFELKKSRQQIYRLVNIYKNLGESGFIHKNRGRNSEKKIDRNIIEELEKLYLNEYYDYNFIAFHEELISKYNYKISYDVILKEFKKDDIISPLAHKKTIKLYNEKMNDAIKNNNTSVDEEKLELFETRKISFEQAHVRRSSNMYGFGQEIQMDACVKKWFGDIPTYLLLAVDKGTKKVLFGWFEYEEITRAYFALLFNIIINYGIPLRDQN